MTKRRMPVHQIAKTGASVYVEVKGDLTESHGDRELPHIGENFFEMWGN
jgi:hypothetical protein